MKNRIIIKLINNERKNLRVVSSKACYVASYDICQKEDFVQCGSTSTDICIKDYAACTLGATDYCGGTYDYYSCHGASMSDFQ